MGPRALSRYLITTASRDDAGRLVLSDREPFRFQELPDTRTHVVALGDTLFQLAGRYYQKLPRGCGLWWVIADFQPDPIVDPTLELELGRVLFVPSVRTLTDLVFSEARRRAAQS